MSEKQPVYRNTEHERMFESSYLKIEEAQERAKNVLADAEVKMALFDGLYDEVALKRDEREVARLESVFDRSPSKIFGDILEAIVCEHGELSDWFGPQAQVIKSARFDDYINKIDMVVEFEDAEKRFSYLALGVDVTFGSQDLSKKFAAIRARIDSGELGEVKYFHSERQHFTGRKRKVPQVVIGTEMERVKELGLLWMNRKNKELGEHPVQITILEEIVLQLETFADYARRADKDAVATIFDAELLKVRELLREKKKNGMKGMKDDKVFAEIERQLLSFSEVS
ncbi:MAG: hypothetical protein ACYC1Y_02065 [Minisyncoccota bacterium]